MFRVYVCRPTEVLLLSQFNKPVFVCLLFTCRMLAMENRPDPFAGYTRLTSQKLAGRHDISKLHYTDQEVHTTSPSPVVVDLKKTTAYQIVVGGETSL